MCGDGTNNAPALAQSNVGVAMTTGTQAAREPGNMVDLDNNPTKLIEIVGIGNQLLITSGALTTCSIPNDVAKYFAILPAIFVALYPRLDALNLMGLTNPQSAIRRSSHGSDDRQRPGAKYCARHGAAFADRRKVGAVQTDDRPSPDALLREAKREGRGSLKMFLGAAHGVGKTFEML